MSVNEIQVGGSHYKTSGSAMQHWDLVELHGIGYLEAAATKYIQRRKDPKARLQDLEKSGHYVAKLRELHLAGKRFPRGAAPQAAINAYCAEFNLSELEKLAISLLFRWRDVVDLDAIETAIKLLIEQTRRGQAQ